MTRNNYNDLMACRKPASFKHKHHGGKGSEQLLDIPLILSELEIKKGQTILDAGCGSGYMAKAFAERVGPGGSVYAIDCYEDGIKALAAEAADNLIAQVGDITQKIELASESVDLLYLSTVLHGFDASELAAFCQEAERVLKPDGRLAIVEIQKENTPFGPPAELRFSPEEMATVIPLPSLKTVAAGQFFYMQLFQNK